MLRKLPNLIEMLLSSLIGFDKTHEQSLRKRPENSSIPAALQAVVIFGFFFFFNVDFRSICQIKDLILSKISVAL